MLVTYLGRENPDNWLLTWTPTCPWSDMNEDIKIISQTQEDASCVFCLCCKATCVSLSVESLVSIRGEPTLKSVKVLSSISKNFSPFNFRRSIIALRPFSFSLLRRNAFSMAILSFFQCEILVKGVALREYDDDDVVTEREDNQPGLTSVKYVEAISGAEFSVGYGLLSGWTLKEDLAIKIFLDGKHSQTNVYKKAELVPRAISWVENGIKLRSCNDWYLRRYQFADIVLGKLRCNSQFCNLWAD